MSPGAACGDPRAALGYLEARRHAQRVSPEGPGNPALTKVLAPRKPQEATNWWLWFRNWWLWL